MLRLLAYMAGLAVLGGLAAIFFRLPAVVAAVGPAPRPQWIEVERPRLAFELSVPELGGPASGYAIFRRARWRAQGRAELGSPRRGPMSSRGLPSGRPGRPVHRPVERGRRAPHRLPVTDDVKPAGVIHEQVRRGASSISPLRQTAANAAASASPAPFTILRYRLPGGHCSAGKRGRRPRRACLRARPAHHFSAAGDAKVANLFARAELKRSFCGRRNPILAATPEGRTRSAEPRSVKLARTPAAVGTPFRAQSPRGLSSEIMRITDAANAFGSPRGAPSAQSADFATQKRGPPPERLFPTAQAGYIVSTEQARRHACNCRWLCSSPCRCGFRRRRRGRDQEAAARRDALGERAVIQPTRTIIHHLDGRTTIIVVPRRSYLDVGNNVPVGYGTSTRPPDGDPGTAPTGSRA